MKRIFGTILVIVAIVAAFIAGRACTSSPILQDAPQKAEEIEVETTSTPQSSVEVKNVWVYWVDPETGDECLVTEDYIAEMEFKNRRMTWGDGTPLFEN